MAMSGEWPDKESIRYLWGKIVKLVDKKFGEIKIPEIPDATVKTDSTLMDRNGLLSVSFPNRELTKEQYEALSEEERNAQMLYVVTDEESAPSTGGGIPSGVIVSWYGTADTVPDGWAICDGANGTPDLRNRFVIGAGSDYPFKAVGGQSSNALKANNIPRLDLYLRVQKNETGSTGSSNKSIQAVYTAANNYDAGLTGLGYAGSWGVNATGAEFTNLPPYYALYYIMKL